MKATPGPALAAALILLISAQVARGQSNTLDTMPGALDLQARRLLAGDSEKNVTRKMGRPPDTTEDAVCETPPQACRIYEYRDADDSIFVYFARSAQKPHDWILRGLYRQGFWRPLSPADVIK